MRDDTLEGARQPLGRKPQNVQEEQKSVRLDRGSEADWRSQTKMASEDAKTSVDCGESKQTGIPGGEFQIARHTDQLSERDIDWKPNAPILPPSFNDGNQRPVRSTRNQSPKYVDSLSRHSDNG